MVRRAALSLLLALSLAVPAAGCAVSFTARVDARAPASIRPLGDGGGGGLDRSDLDAVMAAAEGQLLRSPFFARAAASRRRTTLGVLPLADPTGALDAQRCSALASELETGLVGQDVFLVVGHQRRPDVVSELDGRVVDVLDPEVARGLGRRLGVAYLLVGEVVDRAREGARSRYAAELRVVEVGTGRVVYTQRALRVARSAW